MVALLFWISSSCAVIRSSSCISFRLRVRNRLEASLLALRFSAWVDEPDFKSKTHGIKDPPLPMDCVFCAVSPSPTPSSAGRGPAVLFIGSAGPYGGAVE